VFRVSWRLQLGPVKTAAGRCEMPLLSIARDVLTRQADPARDRRESQEWAAHDLLFSTR
jgi:hypothetical protein